MKLISVNKIKFYLFILLMYRCRIKNNSIVVYRCQMNLINYGKNEMILYEDRRFS